MTDTRWDKYAIVKCPGCGSAVADNRSDNVVRFRCGAEQWAPAVEGVKGRFIANLACLQARLDALETRVVELERMHEPSCSALPDLDDGIVPGYMTVVNMPPNRDPWLNLKDGVAVVLPAVSTGEPVISTPTPPTAANGG